MGQALWNEDTAVAKGTSSLIFMLKEEKKTLPEACIHCGKCISVCPAKAISWKGEKLFLRENDTDAPTMSEVKPLNGLLQKTQTSIKEDEENA